MLIISRKVTGMIFFGVLFIAGVWIGYHYQTTRFKIGEHYFDMDPYAKINPEKRYQLEMWDYDWPESNYQSKVNLALVDFQKRYPNIKVTVKWLDWSNGEQLLKDALVKGAAPDVYCSAYDFPSFNYKFQIPVGPFLNESERKTYDLALTDICSINGVLGYIPRWVSLKLWLGNPVLLEKCGYSALKIQNEGLGWPDLNKIGNTLPEKTYILVGNPKSIFSEGKFFNFTSDVEKSKLIENILILKNINKTKKIPSDYNTNMIERFILGETAVICGIRPVLYKEIKKIMETRKINWSPLLMSYPLGVDGKGYQPIETGLISIYRNRRTKGNDHIVAAFKLGQFLSSDKNLNAFWQEKGLVSGYLGFGRTGRMNQHYQNILKRVKFGYLNTNDQQEYFDRLFKKMIDEKSTIEEIAELQKK